MCRCSESQRVRYGRRISGPLLDRIDIHVAVPAVPWSDLERSAASEPSAAIRERVEKARRVASRRFPRRPAFRNSDLAARDFERFLPLEDAARTLLGAAVERMHLSARAAHRSLRVARTIADLAGSEIVAREHVAEAIGYRNRSFGQEAGQDAGQVDRVAAAPLRST
jgi:magnesium chelatase family protein